MLRSIIVKKIDRGVVNNWAITEKLSKIGYWREFSNYRHLSTKIADDGAKGTEFIKFFHGIKKIDKSHTDFGALINRGG